MARPMKRTDTDIGWINRKFAALERELRELRAAKGLRAASIGEGGITIKDEGGITVRDGGGLRLLAPDGTTILWVVSDAGNPDPDGNPQPSVFMYRADGSLAMSLEDPLPNVDGYRQILRFWDQAGNQIFAEDATSGVGIATPWLPFSMYPANYTDWPTTTSSSFETLWVGQYSVMNPTISLAAKYTTDVDGTTGQVRFKADDVVVGDTQNVGFGIGASYLAERVRLPASIEFREWATVTLEARRTGGTGNVMCAPYSATGSQS